MALCCTPVETSLQIYEPWVDPVIALLDAQLNAPVDLANANLVPILPFEQLNHEEEHPKMLEAGATELHTAEKDDEMIDGSTEFCRDSLE